MGSRLRFRTRLRAGGTAPIGYDADAIALFARFTTPPDDARKAQINTFIVALKAAGVWAKLDCLYVMAAADAQAARRNWISDAYNLTAASSPLFSADRGYTGDGAAAALTTGFTPSTAPGAQFSVNSACGFVWSLTDATGTGYTDIGNQGSLLFRINSRRSTGINSVLNHSDLTTVNSPATADSLGLSLTTRRGSASTYFTRRNNDTEATQTATATAVPSTELSLLTQGTANFSVRQLAIGGFGSGLSTAECADLYTASLVYLQAVGAS